MAFRLLWPVPAEYRRITQYFKASVHNGVDLGTPNGTPGRAGQYGTVVFVRDDMQTNGNDKSQGYGNRIDVDFGNGWMGRFAHLKKSLVRVGDKVTPMQVIYETNHTGYSTGPHLHWGLYRNGYPIDPLTVVTTDLGEITDPPPPPVPIPTPDFPVLPKAIIKVGSRLRVRLVPNADSLSTFIYWLKDDDIVPVIDTVEYNNGDLWLQIGHKSYCAMRYEGVTYAEWLPADQW